MTNSKYVPKRRFKEFESDGEWENNKLDEVALFSKGKGYSKSDLQKKGSPIILYGRLYTKYETVISEVDTFTFIKENSVLSKGGEVLVPSSGESSEDISRASVVLNEGVILGGDLNIIKLQKKIEPVFLSLAISNGNQKKELSRRAQGKSVVHLNNDDLKQVTVLAPTINEQKEISDFFSVLDKLITLHQHKLDKLKNLKKSYLAELFPAEGQRVPKRRFPGFEGEWEEKKLGEITTYRNGTGHEEKQSRFGKYELVNLNSISIDGGLKPSGRFIEEASETLMKNDLVMVLSDVAHGDLLGRVAVIPENDKFVLNQRVALLRHNGIVDIKYLFSFINAHQKYFKLQGAGSSQLNLSRDSVENFKVALPSVEEQKTIGNFLEKLDKSISLQQEKLAKLKDLKKAYLNELFV